MDFKVEKAVLESGVKIIFAVVEGIVVPDVVL